MTTTAHVAGIRRVADIRLLTNNPQKSRALRDAGIEIFARVACEAAPNPISRAYLATKRDRMGHALSPSPWNA